MRPSRNGRRDPVVEASLRETLIEHARHAPATDEVARRIVAAIERPPAHPTQPAPPRGLRTWGLPLVAAAGVAVVVTAVVGLSALRPQADRAPAGTDTSTSTVTPSAEPYPTTQPSSPYRSSIPHRSQTSIRTSRGATKVTPAVDTSTLHGVRVLDLTFVGANEGWALASANCVYAPGTCTALLRTTDGTTWHSMPGASFNVAGVGSCADPCVQHLRFADDRIGYAFGPDALFMTRDGGTSWARQPGGADALETLAGNVIRVVDPHNCPPGCTYSVEVATVGSDAWRPIDLPGPQGGGDSVQLALTGHFAALQVYGNPAGGAPALSVLFTSSNDGATWTRRGEPCPQPAGGRSAANEIDSSTLTAAVDGSITILCTTRGGTGPQFTTTSTDGGATFVPGNRIALYGARVSAFAAASAGTVLVSSDRTYRSTDGGHHFVVTADIVGVQWLGFESNVLAHAISKDNRIVWTTHDAGRTWAAHHFG